MASVLSFLHIHISNSLAWIYHLTLRGILSVKVK